MAAHDEHVRVLASAIAGLSRHRGRTSPEVEALRHELAMLRAERYLADLAASALTSAERDRLVASLHRSAA